MVEMAVLAQRAKKALLIAAPASGSGKTVLTLALLRAFRNRGVSIGSAKAGPDYIDPAFHQLASNRPSFNLDPWAMLPARLGNLASADDAEILLIEAMMGLFDGAADGSGSAAELAKKLNLPVVLVVDAAKQSHSIAALVQGFRDYDPLVRIAGVILNKVGSARHEQMLRQALEKIEVRVFGAVPRLPELKLPERHLGLVQAGEQSNIERFIETAAGLINQHVEMDKLAEAFGFHQEEFSDQPLAGLPPLGQNISIARDEAFSFCYPHFLRDWQNAGAEISFFSPLQDEAPKKNCDAVYFPGGYPELHCGRLAAAQHFQNAIQDAAKRDALIYGECGGYMVLGQGIIDQDGVQHKMLGLLELETSFAKRKLHLGYRKLAAIGAFALGKQFKAHEFHYSVATREEGNPLFAAEDALGTDLGKLGLRKGRVMGSYMHLIDGVLV